MRRIAYPRALLLVAAATVLASATMSPGLARAAEPGVHWVTAPTAGSTVSGVLTIAAASDDGSKVRLRLLDADGYDELGQTVPSGASYALKTYLYPAGPVTLEVEDASYTNKADIPLTLSDPPVSGSFVTPLAGAVLATPGVAQVAPVEPVAGFAIDFVSYTVDGNGAGSSDAAPWAATLPDLVPGSHLLQAVISDSAGRTTTISEQITTVRATTFRRLDAPHTTSAGRRHALVYELSDGAGDPRSNLGVTLRSRPVGSRGTRTVVAHAVSNASGGVSFALQPKVSMDLQLTLDTAPGYAPAAATGTLTVTTSLRCQAHRVGGLVRGSCSVSPRVQGRGFIVYAGRAHGRRLAVGRVNGSQFSFAVPALSGSTGYAVVLAAGNATAGAKVTVHPSVPVAGGGPSTGGGGGITVSCGPNPRGGPPICGFS